jgi:hypothetical protein
VPQCAQSTSVGTDITQVSQRAICENWSETSIHASQAIHPVQMAKRIARDQAALCVLAADGDRQRLGSECLNGDSRGAKQAAAQATAECVIAMRGHEGMRAACA